MIRFNTIGKDIFEDFVIPNVKAIGALVYNPINHSIILFDSASRKIIEFSLQLNSSNVLVDQDLNTVVGLDIGKYTVHVNLLNISLNCAYEFYDLYLDVVGENLYWLDSGKNTLEVISLRTRARMVILANVEDAYDLLVVPTSGYGHMH